jgi:hypothetical protein
VREFLAALGSVLRCVVFQFISDSSLSAGHRPALIDHKSGLLASSRDQFLPVS